MQGSFLKYTAHEFRKMLYGEGKRKLVPYQADANNKEHDFWQGDPLAVTLYSRKVAFQKPDYIHYNPLSKHWQLAEDPCEYKYSSARYYEMNLPAGQAGEKDFSFLKDLRDEF